jgi:hypothetical protein
VDPLLDQLADPHQDILLDLPLDQPLDLPVVLRLQPNRYRRDQEQGDFVVEEVLFCSSAASTFHSINVPLSLIEH